MLMRASLETKTYEISLLYDRKVVESVPKVEPSLPQSSEIGVY